MLVTRQYDTEHSHWHFNRYDPSRNPTSPRMSNPYDVNVELPAPSSWQGQNSANAHGGTSYPQPFGQRSEEARLAQSVGNRSNALGIHMRPGPNQAHALTPVSADQRGLPLSEPRHLGAQDERYATRFMTSGRGDSASTESGNTPTGSKTMESMISGHQASEMPLSQPGQVANPGLLRDEEEDDLDDEDMFDGDGEHSNQTAAERAAARRKMKRFRLTHQQTRFLMSEFAKQPHPDAAHRDRLSREIPGLSPRQVQVWFQNRRAKIKRLNADDRDRMIKMRAVPEGFDNVQALHSPYGAVTGLGTPVSTPGQFNTQSYAQHMMRPLIVDVRRTDPNEHASPTGMNPGFGGMGYSPAGSMNSPSVVSPLSPAPGDRYAYGGHFPPPLTGSPRMSHPFGQHHSLETPVDMSRQSPHPLQPPLLRDTMSRARSESSQSPLRSTMSWKGDAIDYSSYRAANTSPNLADRHPPLYQPAPVGQPPSRMEAYDVNSFPGNRTPPGHQAPNREVERA
ncbi:hypothetical protein FZEAL_5001 [Fusarium zealandicum]|uniref:Homeobox domain-containing protein n=1 Tax=Fusarium zealandicum TaxID=1053134 RepID=A0A8H4UKL5_9HYPO|nr:hypothetical protein FZEAL_5001 [Fusarium zealandicum]